MRIKLSNEKTSKCTALINGQLVNYDACGSSIRAPSTKPGIIWARGQSTRLMG